MSLVDKFVAEILALQVALYHSRARNRQPDPRGSEPGRRLRSAPKNAEKVSVSEKSEKWEGGVRTEKPFDKGLRCRSLTLSVALNIAAAGSQDADFAFQASVIDPLLPKGRPSKQCIGSSAGW
jgi:hypothetical protein